MNKTLAQGFIEFSKLEDSISSFLQPASMQVVDGKAYTLSLSYGDGPDIVIVSKLTKYRVDGSVEYSAIIHPDSTFEFSVMKILNGEAYLFGREYLGSRSAVVKLNSDGTVAFTKIYPLYIYPSEILPGNNEMLIAGQIYDPNFPMTMGGTFPTNSYENGFIAKLSLVTGEITQSMYTGFSPNSINVQIENGAIYFTANTQYYSAVLPVTIGSVPTITAPGDGYVYVKKIKLTDFSTIYSRYVSELAPAELTASVVYNGEFYLTGTTTSPNFTVTNGSAISPGLSPVDGFFTKLNADGSIGFSTYLSLPGFRSYPRNITVSNGKTYLGGKARNVIDGSNGVSFVYQFNPDGSTGYSKQFSSSGNVYDYASFFEIINGELYFAGYAGPNYPVTDGSQYQGYFSQQYTHLDAYGNIRFASYVGGDGVVLANLSNNRIFLASGTEFGTHPATDGSTGSGSYDNFIFAINTDDSQPFSSYLGGSGQDIPLTMQVDNGSVYIYGITESEDYPLTDDSLFHGTEAWFLTKVSFCPANYAITNDTLSPGTQTACKYGLAATIYGEEIILPGDSLPMIYRNGAPTLQRTIEGATYQWQKADLSTGPWTNIANATLKDYRPQIGNSDQYYRRQTFMPAVCGSAFIHTSDTAVVLVNSLIAPTVDAGGSFVTCPFSPIVIGGNPTATGGNPPYTTFVWNAGVDPVANPTVTPANNTIYTLTVQDAAGCEQTDQAIVLVYKANAGADKSSCAGSPVKIGGTPVAGVPGVNYLWQPSTNLTNATIAQPFANPSLQAEYDLTLTLPKTGGGTCITHDTVKVTPVAGPSILNFAGPDVVTCLENPSSIGTSPEPGFSYSWSGQTYLANANTSLATYSHYGLPTYDPLIYQLSAYKSGCTFTDQVVLTVITSKAGNRGCGPRLVGSADETPYINETYSWIKVSGPGNFTGTTNLPQVPVSASIGVSTVYGLTVSYDGISCYSEVVVPDECLSDCNIIFNVMAEHGCPGFNVNNGHVTLQASGLANDAMYTWTPQAGLSTYTGNTVSLTDNIPRTYTVTVTNAHDTSVHCSDSIYVNDPALVLPVFPAPDTVTCFNQPVMIGLPPVAGDLYTWLNGAELSDVHVSNPLATPQASATYSVFIVNSVNCFITEDITVIVQNDPANAGADWLVCDNGLVTLGTDSIANTAYLWEPQSSAWQNGTNQLSALPAILASANVTYTLTTTTTAGCISTDTVHVSVTDNPTIPDAPDTLICFGYGRTIGSPAMPGVSYQWIPATGLDDPTAAQPLANPTASTTYILTATFPGGCSVPAVDQVTVTVSNPVFNMPDIHFCPSDGPVSLGVNAPGGMNLYIWQPVDLVTDPFGQNPSTLDPPPNMPMVFTLFVDNVEGCSYQDTITIIPSIQPPIAGIDRNACKDQPVNIGSAANITGPSISYSWNPANYLNDPSSPNPVFTGISVGSFTYILTKTDNSISCSVTDTVVLTVVDILPSLSAPTVCRNSCVQIGTTTITGIDYVWSPLSGLSDPYVSSPIACIDTTSTTYTLTVSDQSGCTASTSVVIGVNGVPGVQASVLDIVACVGDNNAMLVPSLPPGAYSYLWSPDDGTLSDINIANPIVQTLIPGTVQYGLQITDNTTGCTNTFTANVTVNTCSTLGQAGNFLWFDTNGNGIQDPGELGVSGQAVRLFNNIGFNVATAVTDANGQYNFPSVSPGTGYYIIFNKPLGFDFTLPDIGGITATNNSKADANGRTDNFDVSPLAVISNVDAGIKPTGTVPVTLLSFTATLQNNRTVLLNWQTTAEINNDYFDVERSNDGINFNFIGRVEGNGTTSLPHIYSLIDPHPLNGINYYRLKQVDFDGHFTYSHVEVVELKNNNETITAWYNNQSNSIQLLFNKVQNNLSVKLYASNGQLIKYASGTNNLNSYTMSLPTLATGVYLLHVITDKLRYSKKMFISK